MTSINFAYNPHWCGKPTFKTDNNGNTVLNNYGHPQLFNNHGQAVNLGYGWINEELTFNEFFELVADVGLATTCKLSTEHRKLDNFVSHDVAFVDIDNDDADTAYMKISDVDNDSYYQQYGAAYYASPSHLLKNNVDKFRIIFHLESTIDNADDMKALYVGLRSVYPAADKSCNDPVRLFYGTPKCEIKGINGKVLPNSEISRLIELGKTPVQPTKKPEQIRYTAPQNQTKTTTVFNNTVKDIVEILIEYKKHYPILKYDRRRNVTWSCCTVLDSQEVLLILREMWPDYDSNTKYEYFIDTFDNTKARTIGSLIAEIREHNEDFRKKKETPKIMNFTAEDNTPAAVKKQKIFFNNLRQNTQGIL